MPHIKQFYIIIFISFIGEILNYSIPLPIPASIYGLIIMLACLKFKILKLGQVQDTAEFLVGIMTLMFIPAGVGLIDSWSALSQIIIPVAIITVVTTIFVMAVTGRVTQFVIRLEKRYSKCKS